jgi:subtilisin family serine protease
MLGFALLASAQGRIDYAPGQALVRFDDDISLEQARKELDPALFTVDRVLVGKLNIFLVKISDRLSVPEAVDMLRGSPLLRWAQADHLLSERLTPNDSQFSNQWNMNQASDADVDAPEAWDIATGGTDPGGNDIVVAIVDGGCQLNHPDLAPNLWVNTLEAAGSAGTDDDGNGYIDDINGWDAYNDDGSIPGNDHGTHVSGTVGARGNNGSQVCGINWNVKLMEVAGSTSQTSVASIAYGYVLDQKTLWWNSGGTSGANVVSTNSSFGVDQADCESGSYPVWNDLYNAMGEVGILSCCATANANWNIDVVGDVPTGCSSPYIISVTNTTNSDVKNSGAGYGATTIDLGAPGTNILSTIPTSGTATLTGTSMATPHVAGAVALMHAAASPSFYNYYLLFPDSAALALKQIILDGTDPNASLNGITVSGGRLNLYNAAVAMSEFLGPSADEPFLRYLSHGIDDAPLGDGDGRFNLNETVDLNVTIDNLGLDATNVVGTLTSSDPNITIIDGSALFGNVDSAATGNNAADPFVIQSGGAVPLDYDASLQLTLTADGDYSVNHSFTVLMNPRVIHWQDDVESGANGWTHEPVDPTWGDQWHISTENSNSPSHAWKCGDASTGNYTSLLDAGLISPAILIPFGSELVFSHWIIAETSGAYLDSAYDGGIVEISVNSGAFVQISPVGGYQHTYRYTAGGGNPFTGPLPGTPCLSGNQQSWQDVRFDLSSYAGLSARFRFRFSSDANTTREGWYIDDVRVLGGDFAEPDPVDDLVIWKSGDDVELSWSAPLSGADHYIVYRSTDDAPPEDAVFLGTTVSTIFTDAGAAAAFDQARYVVVAVFD